MVGLRGTLGLRASRSAVRRTLERARMSWKKVEKLLGKADPDKRAAHVARLARLYEQVRGGGIRLVCVDEAHLHRDLGYAWGRVGERVWRKSDCPRLAGRLNCYGGSDFSSGECPLWDGGWCNGEKTVQSPRELARRRAGKGRVVVVWANSPCHTAGVVRAEAAGLGIELVYLPGDGPDLNPIERLWGWMRDEVTRGHCHAGVAEPALACQKFIADINRNPVAVVDRLWPVFELNPEFEEKLRVST